MKHYLIGLIIALSAINPAIAKQVKPKPSQHNQFETRCGWFFNPTPANIWLYDGDAQWLIGIQGGYQVASKWEWPPFTAAQWVKTNVNYGYGCACLEVKVDSATKQVLAINKTYSQPLKVCRDDRALSQWNELFR